MYPDSQPLVHLCGQSDWQQARSAGALRPPSLREAGFVHLSRPAQAHLPANRIFAGRDDLVAVFLDPGRLDAPIHWEPGLPTDPPGMVFPHLYGAVPVAAVIRVCRYPCDDNGRFGPLIHSLGEEVDSGGVTGC